MKKLFFVMTFAFAISSISAQRIEMEKGFGGYKYTQDGNRLTMGALVKTMESNPEAHVLIKKAKGNNVFASILGGAGGFLIGYPLGTAIGGGDPNWVMAGIGAGLVIISIPISSGATKNARKAVDLYNASLPETSFYETKLEYRMVAGGSGVVLVVGF